MIKGVIGTNPDGSVYRYVTVNANILLPNSSWEITKHTTDPDDWCNWGYGGSGPAQLALAILLLFARRREAEALYQAFKWDVIAKLPKDKSWQLPNQRVHDWLAAMRQKGAQS